MHAEWLAGWLAAWLADVTSKYVVGPAIFPQKYTCGLAHSLGVWVDAHASRVRARTSDVPSPSPHASSLSLGPHTSGLSQSSYASNLRQPSPHPRLAREKDNQRVRVHVARAPGASTGVVGMGGLGPRALSSASAWSRPRRLCCLVLSVVIPSSFT